jgi:peptidoglycan hydrolase CwlO-like protein
MSSADPEEVSVEIEREGISVEKSFEPDDFPVPAIAFVIRSEREVPVEVTLEDTVPDDIQAEDIGFHPKYGAEHWRNDGDRLIFERTFEAGEEYTTVYGLRARDTEDVGRFLGEPELVDVVPQGDSSQVVRDVINEGDGAVGGASDDDLEAAIAAADVEEGGEAGASQPEPTTELPTMSPNAVVSMLAEGIRTGQVDDADLETVRDAIGGAAAPSNSLEVRIDHLQNDVADLDAYTTALEEFIDENGEAQTLLRDLRETIEGVESDVAEIRTDVDTVSEEVAETTEQVETVGEDVARLDDAVERVGEDVDDVDSSVGAVEDRLETVDADLSEVDDEVTSLREELSEVHGEVDDVREEIPEGRIDELEGRMDDVRAEIEELSEMRKRMASVFGGMAGGAAGAGGGAGESAEADVEDTDTEDADEE